MKKYDSWLISCITLIFIAVPSLAGLLFVLDKNYWLDYYYMWIIGLGIVVWSFIVTFISYKIKIVSINIFNFAIPMGFVFLGLYVSRDIPWWAMFLVSLGFILTAVPTNMIVGRIKDLKVAEIRRRNKIASKK